MIKKTIAIVLTLILSVSLFTACGDKKVQPTPEESELEAEETTAPQEVAPTTEEVMVQVAGMKGPTGLGMVQLMEKSAVNATKGSYNFALEGGADMITGKLLSGEYDIAALPVNVAAVLYNKTQGEIKLLGVNALGVLYVVTEDSAITSLEDLEGKTVYLSGQGSTPEYVVNHILKSAGLTDVTLEYEAETTALQGKILAGEAPIAILPEPFVSVVTSQNSKLLVPINITEEWEKATHGAVLTTGGLVVRKEFLEAHPEAVTTFMEEYKESVTLAQEQLGATAEYAAKFQLVPNAKVAEKAIPRSNIVLLTGEEMKNPVKVYFDILFASNPRSIGGALPNEDFYYQG